MTQHVAHLASDAVAQNNEREAQIRGPGPGIVRADDAGFLLRRLDEARAEIADLQFRVTELLEANNREVERRRVAEAKNERESEWLRRLLRWARARLKHPSYQVWLDQYLAAGQSPAPEDEPPVTRGSGTTVPDWRHGIGNV
jgi:hypothetical protein